MKCSAAHPFCIHKTHHDWFDKFNSKLFVEDKHTPRSLILWQYPRISPLTSHLINLIPCELDLTSTPFFNTTILTY